MDKGRERVKGGLKERRYVFKAREKLIARKSEAKGRGVRRRGYGC